MKAACERESEREFEELLHKCYFGEPAANQLPCRSGCLWFKGENKNVFVMKELKNLRGIRGER